MNVVQKISPGNLPIRGRFRVSWTYPESDIDCIYIADSMRSVFEYINLHRHNFNAIITGIVLDGIEYLDCTYTVAEIKEGSCPLPYDVVAYILDL